MLEVLRKPAADKGKPPLTLEQLLEGLAKSVPGFIGLSRTFATTPLLASCSSMQKGSKRAQGL
jgi:hypothetical protein